jgi:hypothetical protein
LSLVLLTGCSPPPDPVPRPNVLIKVEGTVRLKRAGWDATTPVGFGTLLHYDDLLEVEGTARILCGDLTLKELTDTTDSCPCPAWKGDFTTAEGTYRAVPSDVPYIQHPRRALVLEGQPLLRWRDTGAGSYTVAIAQGGSVIWRQDGVTGNELRYPTDAPALEPGVDYMLVVQDNDTGVQSGADPAPNLSFRVAASEQRTTLAEQCDAGATLDTLDPAARDYARALCYATSNVMDGGRYPWGAALLLLESVAETHDAPAIHLWMGDLLTKMDLPDAEEAYQAALSHAEALDDLESQAAAHAGLWRVTSDEVYRKKAVELYERLGDDAAQQALEEEK